MTYRLLAATAAVALMGGGARAQDPDADKQAALFGAREGVRQISLSPDGERIAVLAPVPGGTATAVLVGEVNGGTLKRVMTSSGAPEHLRSCDWSAATRLVCQVHSTAENGVVRIGFSRVVTFNADGSDVKLLSDRRSSSALGYDQNGGAVIDWLPDDGEGAVLMTRAHLAEYSTGTHIANTKTGLGVDRVDTRTLKRTVVEQPSTHAVEYITDGRGAVRVRGLRLPTSSDQMGAKVDYSYRLKGDREWKRLSTLSSDAAGVDSGFNPYAVDRDLDVAYGLEAQDGRQALFKVALDGSMKRELVFAHPEVDVDGLIRIGRRNRVVGVSYATDRREAEFFDPELKRLRASLSKALPGAPLVSFVDASADEGKLLLQAGGDVDPGRYFLFDKKTRALGELLSVRPDLANVKLAPVKPVTYPAADGAKVPGYLTLPVGGAAKGLPAIVMPHGGPGARDEWGFDWLAQYFAARGYAVLQPNFRGSTGYGAGWYRKNGFQSWRTAVGDVNDAGRWLVAQGVADPAKLAIVGWSYGGYAALQTSVLDPDLYKAIVAIAPVTDLESLREEGRGFTNYALRSRFIGQGPHVREGSPAQNAGRIKAPVLLFHGDRDDNVGVGESRLMLSKLKGAGKKAEFVEFPGLDHQLDDDRARTRMLAKADAFLRAAMGL